MTVEVLFANILYILEKYLSRNVSNVSTLSNGAKKHDTLVFVVTSYTPGKRYLENLHIIAQIEKIELKHFGLQFIEKKVY